MEGIAFPREERKHVGSMDSREDTLHQSRRPSDDWWTGSWYKGKDYSLKGYETTVTNFPSPNHRTDNLEKKDGRGGNVSTTWSYNSKGSAWGGELRLIREKGITSLSCH